MSSECPELFPITEIVKLAEFRRIENYKYCIYCIKNIINNKLYFGQCSYFHTRIGTHLSDLRGDKHYNGYLQRSFNKYGADSFVVFLVEKEIDFVDINLFERFYIHKFKTLNPARGYNLTDVVVNEKASTNKEQLINFARNTKQLFKELKATNINNSLEIHTFQSMLEGVEFARRMTGTKLLNDSIASVIRDWCRGKIKDNKRSKYYNKPPFGYEWEFIN